MNMYDSEFIFKRYNKETHRHEDWHLIDIIDSLTNGSFENFTILWPEHRLSDYEYKKYAFLLHCIEIRKRDLEKKKYIQEQTEWEELIQELNENPLT